MAILLQVSLAEAAIAQGLPLPAWRMLPSRRVSRSKASRTEVKLGMPDGGQPQQLDQGGGVQQQSNPAWSLASSRFLVGGAVPIKWHGSLSRLRNQGFPCIREKSMREGGGGVRMMPGLGIAAVDVAAAVAAVAVLLLHGCAAARLCCCTAVLLLLRAPSVSL